MKGNLGKRVPTEARVRKYVAEKKGIYGGEFPHPLKDNEDYERFYALKTPRNMLMVEAIWHRKKCFVFFIPCDFPDYKVKPIQTMASYEDQGPLYTHKKPGVRDIQASRKAKAEKVGT